MIIATLIAGCQLPMQRSESQSVKATESIAANQALMIESVVQSHPIPTNTVYSSRTTVNHDSAQTAGSTEDTRWTLEKQLPWGVALILFAVGGFLVLRLGGALKRSSASAAAILSAGDAGLAGAIKGLRHVISTISDDKTSKSLESVIGAIESDRGKLGKAK